MAMNRRAFLSLFGCGVIGLSMDWSKAPVPPVASSDMPRGLLPGYGEVYDLFVASYVEDQSHPYARGSLMRSHRDGTEDRLLDVFVAPQGTFLWAAPPAESVVFYEGHGLSLQFESQAQAQDMVWNLTWRAHACASVTGCHRCGTPYFAWPAGGTCYRCGAMLPAPLRSLIGGRYASSHRDGRTAIVRLDGPGLAPHLCKSDEVL